MAHSVGRSRLRVATLSLCVFQALVSTGAFAQTAPPFSELLRQTVDAPRRIEFEADLERAEALAQQARARPNPTVSAFTENVAGQAPYAGGGRAEHTLQVNQPLELFGKRAARVAAADASVLAVRARGTEGRLGYADELARAYAEAEIEQRRVELAKAQVEEAQADLKVANALVAAGKEARLRSLQAETELDAMRAELATAKARSTGAFARLAAIAGQPTPYSAVSPSLLEAPAAMRAPTVEARGTAAVLAAQAEREAAARRVVVASRQARPDVTVSLGVRRLEADDASALVAGVSVPLPLFDRNRGNIGAAQAELHRAEARAAAALLEANAEISTAHALGTAADARVAAAAHALQTAQETYRLARIAYDAGKSPLIELIAARRGLGAARAVVLEALAARLDARARVARLQGLAITGDRIP